MSCLVVSWWCVFSCLRYCSWLYFELVVNKLFDGCDVEGVALGLIVGLLFARCLTSCVALGVLLMYGSFLVHGVCLCRLFVVGVCCVCAFCV